LLWSTSNASAYFIRKFYTLCVIDCGIMTETARCSCLH